MLNRLLIATATIVASISVGFAGTPQGTARQEGQSAQASQASSSDRKLHVEACLFPKRALSSTQPVTVLPGSNEDYVVTDTKVISASPGVNGDRQFLLKDVTQDELRQLAGKRVGVSARVEEKPDLPELRVISIRETSGSCPLVPTPRS